ncbi:SMP-30/gluconolactonase/LRE family protein [Sphingomonas sp. AP4-R1]|uniref:SMP-30/gluconolactonase/LRE family protein n=1 Tax=Sphingomonas sp. AP4-R1 TaxID=2735134 RepID=UPI001493CD7E|nr:SMP-30/gluconolactonase/LRE family protein [Sphingomonas sp. AP4-R1]QJU58345.1 SMP-30/gluconolactonase/LRE family protein [Sphingomonas sp. AP4-R1]
MTRFLIGVTGAGSILLGAAGGPLTGVAAAQGYAAQGDARSGKALVAPAIAGVTKADTRIEVIREGFNGTEGPVALDDGSILFTENRADKIVRIAPDGTISTYADHVGGANALAVGAKGDLYAAQTQPSAIAILKPTAKIIAKDYKGKAFNRPNDLVLAHTGNVYFTDPGAAPQPGSPPAATAVYRVNPRGRVTLIADDIARPNGIALSPDERTLYVANTAGDRLLAFTVRADGSAADRRDFAQLQLPPEPAGSTASGADGIVVDADGRVYVATRIGVQIFAADGRKLGVIALPNAPQNLAFGGGDRSRLFVVGRGAVYRIATLAKGIARPGK